MRLAIVTASTDPERARDCITSWRHLASDPVLPIIVIINGNSRIETHGRLLDDQIVTDIYSPTPQYLGSVPAFQQAVTYTLENHRDVDVIACLHDDFRIDEPAWDQKVIRHFERHPGCGLLGFGGAVGLGSDALYKDPYDPMQLARIGFRSNLVDAEAHGLRSLLPERVACLDGFSQVGTRHFWDGYYNNRTAWVRYKPADRPWDVLVALGFVHHAYDGVLGCLAKRYGWETWYLPLRGHHFGGRTAVGDAGYNEWANTQIDGGDQGLWASAHRIWYEHFKAELPIRI